MKEEKLIELIHKRATNELTNSEKEQLKSLLVDKANQKIADQIESVWAKSADYKKDYQPNVELGLSKLKARMASEKAPEAKVIPMQNRRSWLRIAAVAAVFIVGGWFTWNSFSSNMDWQNVAVVDAKKEMKLSDGSQVWVNQKSNFSYPTEFSDEKRLVKLSGEAFFDITKNPKKPFIIESGDLEVKVLGTSFNVRNYENENFAQITVRSGKVQVTSKSNKFSPKILTANDRLVFDKIKKEADPVTHDENLNDLAWWSGKIEFPTEESRKRIIEVIARAYNVLKDGAFFI